MENKTIHVFLLLILSGCYFTNFAENKTSDFQCDNVPVLIPNYSPVFYKDSNPPVQFQWHKIETADTYGIEVGYVDSFPGGSIITYDTSDTFYNGRVLKLHPARTSVNTIYWKVRVEKDKGTIKPSPWSVSSVVFINSKLPVFIPHENPTHTRNPTLKWHPPLVKSSRCTLKVYSDSLSLYKNTNYLYVLSLKPEDTSYTFVSDTLDTGTVYWKLEYDGLFSSPVQSFTIVPEDRPIPVPFNVTNSKRPEFIWKNTSQMKSYTFELDDDINFSSPIISTPVSSTVFVPSRDIYKDISDIKKRYYWRVRSNETLKWSITHEFIIDTVPLLHKYNGNIYNNPLPKFQWDKVENSDKHVYQIQIADNHCFKPVYIEKNVGDKAEFTPINKLQKKKIYFWRVGYSMHGKNDFDYTEDYDSIRIDSINVDYIINITKQLSDKKIEPYIFFSSQKLISFSIVNPLNRILGLYVFNLKGKNIHSIILNGKRKNSIEWDYSFGNKRLIPHGMYLIKIISEKKVFYKKILYCY